MTTCGSVQEHRPSLPLLASDLADSQVIEKLLGKKVSFTSVSCPLLEESSDAHVSTQKIEMREPNFQYLTLLCLAN